jgi:radical SAM superfamily enzyme YgiQ (UPF0313 family)
MKCTLIRCPQTLSKYVSAGYAVPPIGLAYVAASLAEAGHEVEVIDTTGEAIEQYTPLDASGVTLRRGLTNEQILDRLRLTDLVGFSLMFSQDWLQARELIRLVRAQHPKAALVAGGEHFSAEPEGAMADSPLDFVIVGEGDRVICELIEHLEGKRPIAQVPGCWYRTPEGAVVKSGAMVRVKDIDTLPWPAWELIPIENYLSGGHGWGVDRGRNLPINATRGCPYQCTFCSSPTMWSTRWTARKPADVVDEIKHYMAKYQATNFDFQDLTAILRKDWVVEFCNRLLAENLKITWQLPTGTRSEALDADVLPLLVRSGCTNITYAPESGTDEILKRIKKKIKRERMLTSMRAAVKAGCNVKANFIFGFPDDTYRDLLPTFRFLVEMAAIGVHDISIAPFRPYPGSELFRELQKEGNIPTPPDDQYYLRLATTSENLPGAQQEAESFSRHMSGRGLDRMRIAALSTFFLVSWIIRPLRVLKLIRAIVTERQESRLDKSLIEMKRRVRKSWRREPDLALGEVNPY